MRVCVCVRERERELKGEATKYIHFYYITIRRNWLRSSSGAIKFMTFNVCLRTNKCYLSIITFLSCRVFLVRHRMDRWLDR